MSVKVVSDEACLLAASTRGATVQGPFWRGVVRFAIRFDNGKYLSKKPNPTWRQEDRRRVVDTLEEATLWYKEGHAKNALLAAIDSGHVPKSTVAYIVPVKLVESDYELGPFKVKATKTGKTLVAGTDS